MPVYLTSAFVLWRGSALLTRPREMPMYHHFLNNMPDEIPIEALISDAQALYRFVLSCSSTLFFGCLTYFNRVKMLYDKFLHFIFVYCVINKFSHLKLHKKLLQNDATSDTTWVVI